MSLTAERQINRDEAAIRLREEKNLLLSAYPEENPESFLTDHSRIIDAYFLEKFENSRVGPLLQMEKNPCALIALGGYGRQEQCVHSDIDILFLFRNKVPEGAKELVREMIYPLWDIGLDIGHAVRTMKECIQLAGEDEEVFTSLLDARFICGISLLFSELTNRVRDNLIRKKGPGMIRRLIKNCGERQERFGNAAFLLEPSLKEGRGGLRDYHMIRWLAKTRLDLHRFRDLEYQGYLSHEEFSSLYAAVHFVLDVRNRLHLISGRKNDQLYFHHQLKLAGSMEYRGEKKQIAVERFLGDLHCRMEKIQQIHSIFRTEFLPGKKRFTLSFSSKETQIEGLDIMKGSLRISEPGIIRKSPEILMRIFEESGRLQKPLSWETLRLVHEFLGLVDDGFRASPLISESFEKILCFSPARGGLLSQMLNTGLLSAYLPPFSKILHRIEYDTWHIYPVDKHLLKTLEAAKSLSRSNGPEMNRPCPDVMKVIPKRLLYWAALLHDIGKGNPDADHAAEGARIAGTLLTRMGKPADEVETVTFLIREHLLLKHVATRRDINDEETILMCARKIKDCRRLKLLYLLTVADSTATGPKIWNEWFSVLLRELFFRILHVLEKGELATPVAVEKTDLKKREILSAGPFQDSDPTTLLSYMSTRYLHYLPVADILSHIRIYESFIRSKAPFQWEVTPKKDAPLRTLTLCARGRPGLFSKVAGVLALGGIQIVEAQVFTWKNGVSFEIFQVTPPADEVFESEKWEKAERDLETALAGKMDIRAELAKKSLPRPKQSPCRPDGTRVLIDNSLSAFFTIIEVHTLDAHGLLFKITDALYRCALDIRWAQIGTSGDAAVDVFYVRDTETGAKADTEEREAMIRDAVVKAVDEADSVFDS